MPESNPFLRSHASSPYSSSHPHSSAFFLRDGDVFADILPPFLLARDFASSRPSDALAEFSARFEPRERVHFARCRQIYQLFVWKRKSLSATSEVDVPAVVGDFTPLEK